MSVEKLAAAEQLLSYDEVQALLNLSRTSLWRLCRDGQIRSYIVRGRRRFSRNQVADYLKRCEVGT